MKPLIQSNGPNEAVHTFIKTAQTRLSQFHRLFVKDHFLLAKSSRTDREQDTLKDLLIIAVESMNQAKKHWFAADD